MTATPTLPLIEAHRGNSSHAPENTLAAFRLAIELPAPWIELDVHPALDGTLVVIHDKTVDRTTDGSGALRQLSVEQLRQLDAGSWFGPAFRGEPVPTLAEVLQLVVPTATRLNVEIKASPPDADVSGSLVRMLRGCGKEREYLVSSFDLEALLQVRAIAPEIGLALIGPGPELLTAAREHGLPWIHVHHPTLSPELVATAHAEGIKVNTWTVDDTGLLESYRDFGIDKLCTNRPAEMLAFAAT